MTTRLPYRCAPPPKARCDRQKYAQIGLLKVKPWTDTEKDSEAKELTALLKTLRAKYTKNDEKASYCLDYFEKNIYKQMSKCDPHIVNTQLLRLIKAASDPADLFVELALTQTTLQIEKDILLINGELNCDGAAFSATTNDGFTKNRRSSWSVIRNGAIDLSLNSPSNPPLSFRISILNALTDSHKGQSPETALHPETLRQLRKTHLRWTLTSDLTNIVSIFKTNKISLWSQVERDTVSNNQRILQAYQGNVSPKNATIFWTTVATMAEVFECDVGPAVAGLCEILRATIGSRRKGDSYKFLQALLTGFENILAEKNGAPFTCDQDYTSAKKIVDETLKEVAYYEQQLAVRGEREELPFHQLIRKVGARAAAFDLYGHIIKRHAEGKTNVMTTRQFGAVYMAKKINGTWFAQDGQHWR